MLSKIVLLAGGAFLMNSSYAQKYEKRKPNILWILAEDICPDLGCYGDVNAKTPNLDRFAKENVRFTNCFTTGAICSASRSAIITGMYQTAIGAQNHRTDEEYKPELPKGVKMLPEHFKDAGYFAALCSSENKKESKTKAGPLGTGKTDFNFKYDEKNAFDGNNWNQRKPGQPFFAYLTLLATHRGAWWKDMEKVVSPDGIKIPLQYPDNDVSKRDFADYYDALALIDKNFGEIIQRLKDESIYDNTIVIFIGDHGRAMPRGKQFCYDEGTHVPLLIHAPEIFKEGTVNDQIVSSIDISATILKMCGIQIPSHFHGISFLPSDKPKREYAISARDRCDETVMRIRTVRDKEFRYIKNFDYLTPYTAPNRYKDTRYPIMINMRELHKAGKLTAIQEYFFKEPRPKEELYDCLKDPDNLNNLAVNPEYKKQMDVMRKRLDAWLKKYPDKGEIKEGEEVMKKILKQRVEEYGF